MLFWSVSVFFFVFLHSTIQFTCIFHTLPVSAVPFVFLQFIFKKILNSVVGGWRLRKGRHWAWVWKSQVDRRPCRQDKRKKWFFYIKFVARWTCFFLVDQVRKDLAKASGSKKDKRRPTKTKTFSTFRNFRNLTIFCRAHSWFCSESQETKVASSSWND